MDPYMDLKITRVAVDVLNPIKICVVRIDNDSQQVVGKVPCSPSEFTECNPVSPPVYKVLTEQTIAPPVQNINPEWRPVPVLIRGLKRSVDEIELEPSTSGTYKKVRTAQGFEYYMQE